jgi:hypothetical protein
MRHTDTRSRGVSTTGTSRWVKTSAECALDALIVAAAVVIEAQTPPRAASRMALLVAAHASGLIATPPHRDVLRELDACLDRLRAIPGQRRRAVVSRMNMLVGGPWAPGILRAARQIALAGDRPAEPAAQAALRLIESALALTPP